VGKPRVGTGPFPVQRSEASAPGTNCGAGTTPAPTPKLCHSEERSDEEPAFPAPGTNLHPMP